jgi:hypothetical protein
VAAPDDAPLKAFTSRRRRPCLTRATAERRPIRRACQPKSAPHLLSRRLIYSSCPAAPSLPNSPFVSAAPSLTFQLPVATTSAVRILPQSFFLGLGLCLLLLPLCRLAPLTPILDICTYIHRQLRLTTAFTTSRCNYPHHYCFRARIHTLPSPRTTSRTALGLEHPPAAAIGRRSRHRSWSHASPPRPHAQPCVAQRTHRCEHLGQPHLGRPSESRPGCARNLHE